MPSSPNLLCEMRVTQIAILVCSKFAVDLHCKSASLQQICHDKSASVKQVCSKLTQASKSPWDEFAADLHCKLIATYRKNSTNTTDRTRDLPLGQLDYERRR
ncbi:hypothetical protein AVEN_225234-1 [Araneus ventricosus]|uniref:Uncharacterized protein n=1 Tax=Araneus ventricosus TaxID=182803 RepID=A0A4Y2AMS4_ARAVE|nr:hypothetical protein AVEN_225234-1 [Araneus ventricosus]